MSQARSALYRPQSSFWFTHISPLFYSATPSGTWAVYLDASMVNYGSLYCNTNGASIEYKNYMESGTWTFRLVTLKNTNSGIVELFIDEVSQGTIDIYFGSAVYNAIFSLTGLSITTPGVKTIKLKISGKNGSSSNYYVYLSDLCFQRTA